MINIIAMYDTIVSAMEQKKNTFIGLIITDMEIHDSIGRLT